MELLNLIGLVMSFVGSLLLLVDPTLWILKSYTEGYIYNKEATLTVEDYSDSGRAKLILQLWMRRIGIVALSLGFLFQLIPAALEYFCRQGSGF